MLGAMLAAREETMEDVVDPKCVSSCALGCGHLAVDRLSWPCHLSSGIYQLLCDVAIHISFAHSTRSAQSLQRPTDIRSRTHSSSSTSHSSGSSQRLATDQLVGSKELVSRSSFALRKALLLGRSHGQRFPRPSLFLVCQNVEFLPD